MRKRFISIYFENKPTPASYKDAVPLSNSYREIARNILNLSPKKYDELFTSVPVPTKPQDENFFKHDWCEKQFYEAVKQLITAEPYALDIKNTDALCFVIFFIRRHIVQPIEDKKEIIKDSVPRFIEFMNDCLANPERKIDKVSFDKHNFNIDTYEFIKNLFLEQQQNIEIPTATQPNANKEVLYAVTKSLYRELLLRRNKNFKRIDISKVLDGKMTTLELKKKIETPLNDDGQSRKLILDLYVHFKIIPDADALEKINDYISKGMRIRAASLNIATSQARRAKKPRKGLF